MSISKIIKIGIRHFKATLLLLELYFTVNTFPNEILRLWNFKIRIDKLQSRQENFTRPISRLLSEAVGPGKSALSMVCCII